VGLRVRELRVALGVTQEEAAERLRMQAPNYARIELRIPARLERCFRNDLNTHSEST
jgi:transcriptional regulator with XRE-family HTH domain